MITFSETTLAWLHKAGWSEDRVFDTSEYEQLLKEAGYPVFPKVVEFLRSFGGLRILFHHARVPNYMDDCNFIIPEAIREPDWMVDDVKTVGKPLCLIGECNRDHFWLLMDESGKVYAGENITFLVANSGPEAVEEIMSNRPFTALPLKRG